MSARTIQGILFGLFFVTCIYGLAVGRSLRNHLREQHPKIYARFGFPQPRSSGWRLLDSPSAKEEEQAVNADWDYWWTIFRGELNRIPDERLQVLLRRRRTATWLAMMLMVACIVSMGLG
jgi:hypothetical protein